MRDATTEKLAQLRTYEWFANAVQPLPDDTAIAVRSWQDAIALASGNVRQSVQTQMRNQIAAQVNHADYDRYVEWDDVVNQLRQSINEFLEPPATSLIARHNLPQAFLHWVHWDLLFICLEVEYSDIRAPKYFLPMLDHWYARGHYPCGWDAPYLPATWKGELPRFRLFVL